MRCACICDVTIEILLFETSGLSLGHILHLIHCLVGNFVTSQPQKVSLGVTYATNWPENSKRG